jgi:hypothetical protein
MEHDMKLNWKRNYNQEGVRDKEAPAFEWYSARWWIITCHVHNKDGDGWRFILSGNGRRDESRDAFETKELAMGRVESIIAFECSSFLTTGKP